MSIIHDYLYDIWNERGVVEDEDTIQEALQDHITCEEALGVPLVVRNFIQTIRPEEGVILFETIEKPGKRIESARI